MLKLIGLVTICLVLSVGTTILSMLLGSNFPVDYAVGSSVGVLSGILALNIATATFLSSGLLNIENGLKKNYFDNVRREIKQIVLSMVIAFAINILCLAVIRDGAKITSFEHIDWQSIIPATLSLAVLCFYIYSLYEVTRAAINIKNPDNK